MQEQIISYLKEKYKPLAIILHGSRANGMAREHSDWDFIFLYDSKPNAGDFRELFEGQNVEVQSDISPAEDILDTFGLKLRGAKLVHDTSGVGEALLDQAEAIYEKGFVWPDTWPIGPSLWMKGRIDGMQDCVDEPLLFYRYFSQFYPRVINDWFRALHHEFPKPEYLALPEIEQRDLEYHKLLVKLASPEVKLKEKVEVARELYARLFPE